MLITLSGIDCSGKSTQLECLVGALESRGERVQTVWFRPGYSREMDGIRAAVRRFRPGAIPSAGHSEARSQAFERPGVARAWMVMALTDTLLQCALKLRASLAAGQTVICDRYLSDARLDLKLRFPEHFSVFRPAFAAVEWLCPRPDLSVLLTIPHDEMLRRMAIKKEPFPDSPELRERRYLAYMHLASTAEVTSVSADRSVEDIHTEILSHVDRRAYC